MDKNGELEPKQYICVPHKNNWLRDAEVLRRAKGNCSVGCQTTCNLFSQTFVYSIEHHFFFICWYSWNKHYHTVWNRWRVKYSLIIFSDNVIHHYNLSGMLVSRRMSSAVTEQMAAILRCKQPATEEGQAWERQNKKRVVANIKRITQSVEYCLLVTVISPWQLTFHLILQRTNRADQ